MRFPSPLVRGRLVQRYKRFLADVRLDSGEGVTAACPNTGAMLGLTTPGVAVWLSRSEAANRKYPHTWEMVEADLGAGPTLVGINPLHRRRSHRRGGYKEAWRIRVAAPRGEVRRGEPHRLAA